MSELATAPQTGDSAPAPMSDASSAPSSAADKSTEKAPSSREALRMAMQQVEAREPSENDRAAAVLKEGAGADDRLDENQRSQSERSERAQRGWETRRENAKTAETEATKTAEQERQQEAEARQERIAQGVEKLNEQAQQKQAEPAAKTETKPATDSKFPEAPSRFSPEAKAAWKDAPEPVKAEINRAFSELGQGFQKYKEGAEKWASMAKYEAMAKDWGVTVHDALQTYIDADEEITRDPIAGIAKILKARGHDITEFAQAVLERGENPTREDPRLKALEDRLAQQDRRIAQQDQQLSQFQQRTHATTKQQIDAQVSEFAKANPRFAELEPLMVKLITLGEAKSLPEAFARAEEIRPPPKLTPPAPDFPASTSAAQTRKGELSISGHPASGSDPAPKKPIPSSRGEAIRMAMRQVGI